MHDLFVTGTPRPQGDLRSSHDRTGKVHLFMAPGVKQWRRDIGIIARSEIGVPLAGPVAIDLTFTLEVPKSEPYRMGPHTQTPDLDKLTRAVLDALKSIAYEDDRQVAVLVARKVWGRVPGVRIRVLEWDQFAVDVRVEPVPLGV